MHTVKIGGAEFGNDRPLALIAGPCVMEGRHHARMIANEINNICIGLNMHYVFKASFDKANRTSMSSYRGIGMKEAIPIFDEIRAFGIPCMTDVHEPWQCAMIAPHVDCLQIPALLARQTDLIIAADNTGLPVNIKKGQGMHPEEMYPAAEKAGGCNVLLTERGTTFGYNNLVVDMRSLEVMKQFKHPVVFDCTHSVQRPAGDGGRSGGDREMAQHLAYAATAIGIAGIFMEVHDDPDAAPCDGPVMQRLEDVEAILRKLKAIDEVVK